MPPKKFELRLTIILILTPFSLKRNSTLCRFLWLSTSSHLYGWVGVFKCVTGIQCSYIWKDADTHCLSFSLSVSLSLPPTHALPLARIFYMLFKQATKYPTSAYTLNPAIIDMQGVQCSPYLLYLKVSTVSTTTAHKCYSLTTAKMTVVTENTITGHFHDI